MTALENMEKILGESGAYRLTENAPLKWELAAYGAGFAAVKEELLRAFADSFAATAGEERLREWEALFLPHPAGCPLEDRREMLSARLRARPEPVSLKDMPGLLLAAGIRGTAEEAGGAVLITPEEYLLPEAQAKGELKRLMPLHVSWSITQ